jgi:hypothetical protein
MATKLDTTNAPGKYTDSTVRDMLVHFMSPLEEGASHDEALNFVKGCERTTLIYALTRDAETPPKIEGAISLKAILYENQPLMTLQGEIDLASMGVQDVLKFELVPNQAAKDANPNVTCFTAADLKVLPIVTITQPKAADTPLPREKRVTKRSKNTDGTDMSDAEVSGNESDSEFDNEDDTTTLAPPKKKKARDSGDDAMVADEEELQVLEAKMESLRQKIKANAALRPPSVNPFTPTITLDALAAQHTLALQGLIDSATQQQGKEKQNTREFASFVSKIMDFAPPDFWRRIMAHDQGMVIDVNAACANTAPALQILFPDNTLAQVDITDLIIGFRSITTPNSSTSVCSLYRKLVGARSAAVTIDYHHLLSTFQKVFTLCFKIEYLVFFNDVSTTIQQLAVTYPFALPLELALLATETFIDAFRGYKMAPNQLKAHLKFESTPTHTVSYGGMARSRITRYIHEAQLRKTEELDAELASLKAKLILSKRPGSAQVAPDKGKKARRQLGPLASGAPSAAATPLAAPQTILPPADQIALSVVRKLCAGFCHSLFIGAGICNRQASVAGCKFKHDNQPTLTPAQKVIMENEVKRVRGI